MQFLKSFLRGLNSLVFKFSLVLLVIVAPLVMVFGTPGPLKQSLRSSKIYDSAVDNIIKNAQEDTNDTSSPFNDPGVQKAARSAITPGFIQNTSEQVIDGIYNWLSRKTAQPEFRIDVSAVKLQFTQAVADYAIARAKQLPVCTLLQTRQLATEKIDPLAMPCVPAGFEAESLRSQVAAQLDKPSGDKNILLQQSVITADNLPKDDQGKSPVQNLTDNANKAPQMFHWFTIAPLIIGGVALVSGGLVVVLYDEKRRGARNLAITLVGVGVLVLISTFLTMYVFAKLDSPSGPLAKNIDGAVQQPALSLIHSLTNAVNHKILLFGIVYTSVGVLTLVALHLTKPKKAQLEGENTTNEETPVLPAATSPSTEILGHTLEKQKIDL